MPKYVKNDWQLRQDHWNDPSSGCPIELQVVQHPTQGRANPPSALEGKGTNQANKKQKKNGNNKQVVGNDAAALSQGQSVGNPPKLRPRVALDPPPVVELFIHDDDPKYYYRNCPHIMCAATLFAVNADGSVKQSKLSGMTVSSMYSVKLKLDGSNHAYFVFQDLCPVYAGKYYLVFTVFTIGTEGMRSMQSTKSDTFVVGEWKAASMVLPPATALTKALSDCGIKLRLRKEPAKRKTDTPDWSAGKPAGGSAGVIGAIPSNGIVSGGPLPVGSAALLHGSNFRIPTVGESIEGRVVYEPQPNAHHLPVPHTTPALQPLYAPAPGPSSYTGPSHTGLSMLNPYATSEPAQNELSGYSQKQHHHAGASYHNMLEQSTCGYAGSNQDDIIRNTNHGRRSQDNIITASNSGYQFKSQNHMLPPSSNDYMAQTMGVTSTSFPAILQGTTSMSSSGMFETTLGSSLPALGNHGYMTTNQNGVNMAFNDTFPGNQVQNQMGSFDAMYHPLGQGSMEMMNNTSFTSSTSGSRRNDLAGWAHGQVDNNRMRGMM